MSNSKSCPSCGSNDWKYAESVYKQGLTYVESSGEQHQTDLSKRAAPPQNLSNNDGSAFCMLIVYLIGLPIVLYVSFPDITFWGAVFS